MLKIVSLRTALLVLGLAVLAGLPANLPAQEKQDKKESKFSRPPPPDETAEEKAERAERNKCTASLCAALHNRQQADGVLTCSVPKTWRKETLTKILERGKVSWPWGNMRCVTDLRIDRVLLVKAMQEPAFEAQLDTHSFRCTIDSGKEAKGNYEVTVEIRPKVAFKQGKAVKAAMNWGKIEAPALARSALWSVTAADNTFGLLQSTAVEDINEFIGTKCLEVKEEWQGR
jgi:hypothetical protein